MLTHVVKMNVQEAINFGSNKLDFADIRENQKKGSRSLPQWSRRIDDLADRIEKKPYLLYSGVCDRFRQKWPKR